MSSQDLMYMNWQQMIQPDKVQVSSDQHYGKFVCEPLERGFGITIGNSLRRIILSSLYGAAITSVKFDSVMHEFSVIPGVLEDVSEIILNLKEVRLKADGTDPRTISLSAKGAGTVVAGDIVSNDGKVEVPSYCWMLRSRWRCQAALGKLPSILRVRLQVQTVLFTDSVQM